MNIVTLKRLVVLSVLFALLPSLSFAESFYVDGVKYEITSLGEVYTCQVIKDLKSVGNINIFFPPTVPDEDYPDDYSYDYCFESQEGLYKGSITVPSTVTYNGFPFLVTSIEKDAFAHCKDLVSVTLPDGIEVIGERAFHGCPNLVSVSIPESVKSIGKGAFQFCSSLASISLPSGITSIGEKAFYDCKSLTKIELPEGVTSIGDNAFGWCTSLEEIAIPASVSAIGEKAFYNCCSLNGISIPDAVSRIEDEAFGKCSSLTELTIPASIVSIGYGAFEYCDKLSDVYNLSLEPQRINFTSFGQAVTIHVTAGYKEAYESAKVWNELKIVDDIKNEADGIAGTSAAAAVPVARYSLNGSRMSNSHAKGIVILKMSDGTVKKVIEQ